VRALRAAPHLQSAVAAAAALAWAFNMRLSSIDPPQGAIDPPQGAIDPPQGVDNPPLTRHRGPLTRHRGPLTIDPPQGAIDPPQGAIDTPHGAIDPPQGVDYPPLTRHRATPPAWRKTGRGGPADPAQRPDIDEVIRRIERARPAAVAGSAAAAPFSAPSVAAATSAAAAADSSARPAGACAPRCAPQWAAAAGPPPASTSGPKAGAAVPIQGAAGPGRPASDPAIGPAQLRAPELSEGRSGGAALSPAAAAAGNGRAGGLDAPGTPTPAAAAHACQVLNRASEPRAPAKPRADAAAEPRADAAAPTAQGPGKSPGQRAGEPSAAAAASGPGAGAGAGAGAGSPAGGEAKGACGGCGAGVLQSDLRVKVRSCAAVRDCRAVRRWPVTGACRCASMRRVCRRSSCRRQQPALGVVNSEAPRARSPVPPRAPAPRPHTAAARLCRRQRLRRCCVVSRAGLGRLLPLCATVPPALVGALSATLNGPAYA
jgi:hypothetical protein